VKLIRISEVQKIVPLSRSQIRAKALRGEFPASVPLGRRAVAWVEQDVIEWAERQVAVSRK